MRVQDLSQEDRQDNLASLREFQSHQGWRIYQVHLVQHLTQKEKVKAESLRNHNLNDAVQIQGYIDGINFVVREIDTLITKLNSPELEDETLKGVF